MNNPNEIMPINSVKEHEAKEALPVELSLNEKAMEYLRDYYDENYRLVLIGDIKEKLPMLDQKVVEMLAEKIASNIRYETSGFLTQKGLGRPLPVYQYHSFLRGLLKKMFASEAKAMIDGFEYETLAMADEAVKDSMTDSDAQYEAAFDRFFNQLIHYNELESRWHDNHIKKLELGRANQKLPVKNLDRRDQKQKQEINNELMKLAKERKQLAASQTDARMLANFVPGYEMDKQEARNKTEADGRFFDEEKFVKEWLEKNAAIKVAQLKKKLVVDSATRQARDDKKWDMRKAKGAKENEKKE